MSKAKKVYDLAVKTGTYEVSPGQTKGRWVNVGAVMEMPDGGRFIMLDRTFNPAGVPDLSGKGSDSVLLTMFEANQQSGQQGGQGYMPPQGYAQPQQHQGYHQPQPHQQQPYAQPQHQQQAYGQHSGG